jgi:ATP-dependent helicase/nuclease subunit A
VTGPGDPAGGGPRGGADPLDPVARARTAQARAADPAASVWLSANAGSGKTRVLTDRVARLLLGGADPSRIRCLTFTKAAAAEMADRLSATLGAWALMEDAPLAARLSALTGGIAATDRASLAQARRLFAQALETPGGLRIGTIHAFCERALKRFPLEAGVSPDFAVLDDAARDAAAALARERLARAAEAGAGADGDDPAAFDAAADLLTDEGLDALTRDVLTARALFRDRPADARLAAAFGVGAADLSGDAWEGFLAGLDAAELARAAGALLAGGGKTDADLGRRLAAAAAARGEARLAPLAAALRKTDGDPRDWTKCPTKATRLANPWLPDLLADLSAAFEAAAERAAAVEAARRAVALNRFGAAFLEAFEREKAARAALDYDDLIARTAALLADPGEGAWALWKLDGGLDHLLVDEAQDTAPGQWDIAAALTAEFGAPGGRRRTLFVVGDEKQSIYGFQGAEPRLFAANAALFRDRLAEGPAPLVEGRLDVSFRSSPAILRVVDRAFAGAAGLTGDGQPPLHLSAFPGLPGRVDLWPPVGPDGDAPEPPWDDPLDAPPPGDPRLRLGGVVAREIARWVHGAEPLPGGGPPVAAGDVLVLVRKRDRLAAGIVRELKRLRVPVAGADRVRIGDELAVRDLLALARVALTPEDDLTLAALLRSPLGGLSEAELFGLAHGRTGSLFDALTAARDRFPAAAALVGRARDRADFLRPYEFLDRALTEDGGRARLLGRLGAEAEDALDELLACALAYESTAAPSLEGFLDWLGRSGTEIKREMDKAGDAVRVMTVHGAKGLEAPVVVVPDMITSVRASRGAVAALADARGPLATWRMPSAAAPAPLRDAAEATKAREAEEARRLLYVAMTRARRWLVLCGAGKPGRDSWHALVEPAMRGSDALAVPAPEGIDGPMLRVEDDGADRTETRPAAPRPAPPAPPARARAAPAAPPPAAPRRAASALADAAAPPPREAPGDGAPDASETARRRGTAIHAVLERAPDWPAADRLARAAALLARLAPEADDAARAAMAAEALGAMDAPGAADFFGPDAVAEAAVSLDAAALGLPGGGRIAGRIDRLVATATLVRAVDFKTDAAPPDAPEAVPEGYLRQMAAYRAALRALYPGRGVELSLLWTASRRVMVLPDALLDGAAARLAAGGAPLDRPSRPT